jgi:vacuolar-type H+-ATPase subunit H
MSDVNLLKKLLEAENSGRELVREAQDKADRRVHDVLNSLQDDFRRAREARLKEITEEAQSFTQTLAEEQKKRLSAFEEALRGERISSEDAGRELRKILSLP